MASDIFQQLDDFIRNRMRMSHVYQPAMLRELLSRGGNASVDDVARSLLMLDQSQLEYYEEITNNMVGRVLTKNHGLTSKDDGVYRLNGFDALSVEEVENLKRLCGEKIDEYTAKRGDRIWEHRTKSSGYIPGTLRYEVLKAAKFRCELCGTLDSEKALEVDHIIPRNKGGSDDINNLQSLCYSCNAMKRDRDATDFRGVAGSYNHRQLGCIFCETKPADITHENALCYAIRDRYPVTALHTLIIPKRHVTDYFGLYQPELNAVNQLLAQIKDEVVEADPTVSGFNIGANSGAAAGQTVFHCHLHLIPRRQGDTEDPRGGVRGVIPAKQGY
jgi:ATP adenylyltransferase